jgi:hypothetical protein
MHHGTVLVQVINVDPRGSVDSNKRNDNLNMTHDGNTMETEMQTPGTQGQKQIVIVQVNPRCSFLVIEPRAPTNLA